MKKLIIILTTIISSTSCFSQTDIDSVKTKQKSLTESQNLALTKFESSFLKALQSEKTSEFEILQPTQIELIKSIESGDSDKQTKDRLTGMLKSNWASFSYQFIEKGKSKFETAVSNGKEIKIKWEKIKNGKFEYELIEEQNPFSSKGLRGVYSFEYNGKKYGINLREVYLLNSEWKIFKLSSTLVTE